MTGLDNAPRSGAPRFLADEDFNGNIVAGLRRRQPAMDILTATQAGTLHLSDPAVLLWTRHRDRILLSHDKRTMPDHFASFLAQLSAGEHSPGVMLIPQDLGIGRAIEAVLEIWECSEHSEWRGLLVRLPL